jgi:hypothetical protein
MCSQEKAVGSVGVPSPSKDPGFPMWRLERQVAEQLRYGVRSADGSVVAVSIGSGMFTYVRRVGSELIVKYVEGCVAVTASAKLVEETKVQVYDVSIHNICSAVDL